MTEDVITGDSVTVLLLLVAADVGDGAGEPGVSLEFAATGVVASSSSATIGDLHVSALQAPSSRQEASFQRSDGG